MKTTRILSIVMTLAMGMIAGLQASMTEHQPPAPLPEFKTPEQLAKWRAEQNQKTQTAASSQEGRVFYTGKPYLAESGSYAFKYREYNPEMGRWTTVDPSGFPDGANNRIYAAVPTSQIDWEGCSKLTINVQWSVSTLPEIRDSEGNIVQSGEGYNASEKIDVDYTITGNNTPDPRIYIPGTWSFTDQPIRTFIDGVLNWSIGGLNFNLASNFTFTQSHGSYANGSPFTDIIWKFYSGGSVNYSLSHDNFTLPVTIKLVGNDPVAQGTDRISATKTLE